MVEAGAAIARKGLSRVSAAIKHRPRLIEPLNSQPQDDRNIASVEFFWSVEVAWIGAFVKRADCNGQDAAYLLELAGQGVRAGGLAPSGAPQGRGGRIFDWFV